ncbi:hypothetical protein ACYSNO_08180 [Enterococcus sp. LJL98]
MAIMETVQALVNSQGDLLHLQERLSMQKEVMSDERLQAFVFDLRDYADSLRILTDFMPSTMLSVLEVSEISGALSDQNKWLRALITQLEDIEAREASSEFFDLSEGELRRLIGSLQGVLELNGMNLQDNLTFQRLFKEKGFQVATSAVPAQTPVKNGLFKRLFGKK